MVKELSGNSAVAWGALNAGVAVAAGYPGTPSSEALGELIDYSRKNKVSPYVEWSTNEKVALEVATGAAWAGQRAFVSMKMSGANVALDTLISVAYSGTRGGLVVYIADDPGAEAGMPEQDTRMIALTTNLPVLEPKNPRQAYALTRTAFELSEEVELPVILRSVTTVAHTLESFEVDMSYHPLDRSASFERDIQRFTKAGALICLNQHRKLLEANRKALEFIRSRGLNRIIPPPAALPLGSPESSVSGRKAVVCSGVTAQTTAEYRDRLPGVTVVELEAVLPVDEELFGKILADHDTILVLEELEPVVELHLRSLAQRTGWSGKIIGKEDGSLPRVDRYSTGVVKAGLHALTGLEIFADSGKAGFPLPGINAEALDIPAVKHPITFCEGCPHRGTYMALNQALRKTKLGQKKTLVTGDIGCTILGMNPPFNSCWTEISMGSSIGTAQGFARGGMRPPVVATIGDSTFFHGGLPQLVNAVQHQTDLLLIILDNGWTSMTGFQVNPNTADEFQDEGARRVDIAKVVEAIGVDMLEVIKPFHQKKAIETLSRALRAEGVRVVISKEECAITRLKRSPAKFKYVIDPEKCTFCKVCINQTGCPALFVKDHDGGQVVAIDWNSCTGCSLCYSTCQFDAIHPQGVKK
jgi:indolepyruvate ferredoxin oxidoreductase alpha subunit